MMDRLRHATLPPELAILAQQMIAYQSQFVMPLDLSYPASDERIAVLPAETVMIVAIIRNTGRLPATIQRCQWQHLSRE